VAPAPGLLNDDDRSLLASYGLEMAPRAVDKLDREMTILYETCTQPTRRLIVSWAAMNPQGEEKRPAFLIGRLKKLFPGLNLEEESWLDGMFRLSAPRPALELAGRYSAAKQALAALPDYTGRIQRMEQAVSMERGSLSPDAVGLLYGQKVPMSASRMDRFKSCHFSYFMQYGLKARPRQEAGFEAPEYGTFVHYVLEHILENPGCRNWDRAQVRSQVRSIMENYIQEELGGLTGKTARFVYLFGRLLRPITQVVWNALEELAVSEFQPISFELGFGEKGDLPPVTFTVGGITVSISGFVDRVDGWEHNGRLYLRVVDYKTGRKSFDLTEIWNGLGLQMLLYLFTLDDKGKELYRKETAAAGILYFPAREAVIHGNRTIEEESRRKLADHELRRRGLLLDDPAVLEAMEMPGKSGLRFLPLRVSKKTGAITGDALVTAERLGRLKTHTEHILCDIGTELAAGNIAADPYWRGPEKNACLYCDYAQACHFEEGRGDDRRRWLPPLDGTAFWDALERRDEPDRN
jgi:ATP-dependent helicase/nuclease subunit B